eukprot:m.103346 g.103346  ORF g.103346 m.103346 type:complete len:746 (+) comp12613_c3_seq4:155-2392(+)
MSFPTYFHPDITKADATALLVGKPDGTFLLRSHQGKEGMFILSAVFSGKDTHHLVAKKDGDRFFLNNKDYGLSATSVVEVIEELKSPVPKWPLLLTEPVLYGDEDKDESEEDESEEDESGGSWYHGFITKAQAEEELRKIGLTDGHFLVRSRQQAYSSEVIVSVVFRGKPTHHLAEGDAGGNWTLNGKPVPCLSAQELVEHLRSAHKYWPVPLTKHAPGLNNLPGEEESEEKTEVQEAESEQQEQAEQQEEVEDATPSPSPPEQENNDKQKQQQLAEEAMQKRKQQEEEEAAKAAATQLKQQQQEREEAAARLKQQQQEEEEAAEAAQRQQQQAAEEAEQAVRLQRQREEEAARQQQQEEKRGDVVRGDVTPLDKPEEIPKTGLSKERMQKLEKKTEEEEIEVDSVKPDYPFPDFDINAPTSEEWMTKFHHGNIDEEEANKILKPTPSGSFLLRNATEQMGFSFRTITLSLVFEFKFYHVELEQKDENGAFFYNNLASGVHSLEECIEFLSDRQPSWATPINKDNGIPGLPIMSKTEKERRQKANEKAEKEAKMREEELRKHQLRLRAQERGTKKIQKSKEEIRRISEQEEAFKLESAKAKEKLKEKRRKELREKLIQERKAKALEENKIKKLAMARMGDNPETKEDVIEVVLTSDSESDSDEDEEWKKKSSNHFNFFRRKSSKRATTKQKAPEAVTVDKESVAPESNDSTHNNMGSIMEAAKKQDKYDISEGKGGKQDKDCVIQ